MNSRPIVAAEIPREEEYQEESIRCFLRGLITRGHTMYEFQSFEDAVKYFVDAITERRNRGEFHYFLPKAELVFHISKPQQ